METLLRIILFFIVQGIFFFLVLTPFWAPQLYEQIIRFFNLQSNTDKGDRRMELNMLIGLVEEMRKKQKEFSQTRNIIAFQQVKTLEKEVDAAILHFKRDARNAGEQQEMF